MPGFIGVRWGEMVVIPPPDDYVDVYLFTGDVFAVGKVDNTIEGRTSPSPGNDILEVWSYEQIKTVRALTADGDGYAIWTSNDTGRTWTMLASAEGPEVQLRLDELYSISNGPVRRSVTGGTTWSDHIPIPGSRSGFSGIRATRLNIYANTEP
jgi:hypothetical protein